MDYKIFKELDRILGGYEESTISLVDGLHYSQNQTIRKIIFYLNSEYLSGKKDQLGREKPFYNIVNFRNHVAYRATDLDVKDVRIYAENADQYALSFILNKEFQNWAQEADFGQFLNDMAETRPKFGGVLVKKCYEKEDGKEELKIDVVPWKNVVTDQVNIEDGVIIEKHYMTPQELSEKEGVWENIGEAIKLASKKRKGVWGTDKSTVSDNRVPIYEIHGIFSEECDPTIENPNEHSYKRMYFVVAGDTAKKVFLYGEEEKESPYKYLAWEKVSGRGLGRGITESAFEAQKWINDAVINEQNTMSIAGKVLLQTDSKAVGENALTDYKNGQFIFTEDGKTINRIDLTPSALPQFQNVIQSWDTQAQRETNTFDAVTGEELPATQTLGATAITAKQASSYFDQRREEAGIFISEIIEDWVLPYLIKKINKEHVLSGQFSFDELKLIDQSFAFSKANEYAKNKILNGEMLNPGEYEEMVMAIQQSQSVLGDTRFIEVPEKFFKNWKIKTKVVITDENMNKMAETQNLIQILSLARPEILQDPVLSKKFYELIEKSGTASPLDFQLLKPQGQNVPSGSLPQTKQSQSMAEQVVPQAQQ